jgi:ribosomal-protein-alanine N-acetyltransferase
MSRSSVIEAYRPADREGLVSLLEVLGLEQPWIEETDKSHAHVLVARAPDQPGLLTGWIVGWQLADELEIAHLGVHPDWRRRSVGSRLLSELLDWGGERGLTTALLEVRESNLGAQRLYAGQGFEVTGVRRGYYDSGQEDAVLMAFVLRAAPKPEPGSGGQ